MYTESSNGEPRSYPVAHAWAVVALLACAAVLSYTDRQILNLLVDPIKADLKISDVQISLLQGAAFAVLYAIAGIPLGRSADLLPRRNIIIAGVLVWSMATAACGMAHSFGQIFAARIFVGIGEAALAPAAISLIADYFAPQRRGTAISVFLMGMLIGGGAAVTIGGLLLSLAHGAAFSGLPFIGALPPWRAVLIMAALPGILIAALLLFIREPARKAPATQSNTQPLKAVIAYFISRRRVFLPLYVGMSIMTAGDYALTAWVPALLSRKFALGASDFGPTLGTIIMTSGVLGGFTAGLAGDFLSRRHGCVARLYVTIVTLLCALSGCWLALASSAATVLLLCGVWSVLMAIAATSGLVLIQDLLPNTMRGMGTSLAAFGNTIAGLGLGPTLVALATEHAFRDPAAVGVAIATVAAPAIVAAAVCFRLCMLALKDPSPA